MTSFLHYQTEIRSFDSFKKKDFDLIFFHTEEYPFKIVQTACRSEWCHIALILMLDDFQLSQIRRLHHGLSTNYDKDEEKDCSEIPFYFKNDESGTKRIYILESTTDTYPCAITGKTSNGVKLCMLSDRLSNGICGYKSVTRCTIDKKNAAKNILIYKIVPRILGIPYERNLLNLVKAWFHWLGCCNVNTYDESSMFCTELITHVFTQLDILQAKHGSSDNMISYQFLESRLQKERKDKEKEQMLESDDEYGNNNDYTDEDLVLEDYVFLERNFLKKDCWLSYGELKLIKIE